MSKLETIKIFGIGQYKTLDLVNAILKKYPKIRQSEEYENSKFWQIEETMSCDKSEQLGWMQVYMQMAIDDDYKITHDSLYQQTKNSVAVMNKRFKLACDFISAYDLM